MGKPLSRPDCLRQNRTCLGKGEDEDGYIEDCYVPQRSIYDTMRINEQIDQGSKLNQLSKSTLGKGDGSTISSNGTLGAANVFESRPPEPKKLDERVIFDQLKLSSDVSKPAPAPPKRRPNPEKKENVNRRSWKSFMPPNFTEFAERMGASLSEVSEAGASNPSLRDKRDSSAMLAEQPGQPEHGEPMSESLTLEHVSKASGTAEALGAKQFSVDGYGGPREERQALLSAGDSRARELARARRLPSATWPRARKNFIRGNFNDGHQETLEASESDSTVENVNLSPCLSEELLDTGLDILITSNLREKTESELRFEEDERWVMMEEWEEATLSERGKAVLVAEEKRSCCLADISEEREQSTAPEDGSAPSPGTSLSCTSPGDGGTPCCTEDVAVQCGVEDFAPVLERPASPTGPELSDTDSVQMFLELEEQCLHEDGGDGAVPSCLDIQMSPMDSEGLDPDSAKLAGLVVEVGQHRVALDISASDSAVVSDLEDFDVTCSSQVLSTLEPLTEPFSERDTLAVTPTDSDGGASPSPVAMAGLGSLLESPPVLGEADPDALMDTELVAAGVTPHPGPHAAAGLGGEGYPSAPEGWGEENQDLLPEGPCPGPVSPCQPPAMEELGSPPGHSQAGTEGMDPFRTHHLLPGRTEVASWDVPELVSEDEATDLGSGSGAEGWTRPAGSGDVCCGSLLPFHAGSASEPGSQAPTTFPVPAEELPWEMVSLGRALSLEGSAHAEGMVAHGGTPAAVLQADVDLLFAPSWEVPCPASPAAPEELAGTLSIAGPAIPWDFGELSAPAHPLSAGDVAVLEPQGMPPATGDPTMDAEEPPGATTTAMPLMVEELLEAPPPFADVPVATVPPPAAEPLSSGARDLGGAPVPLVVSLGDADDFAITLVPPMLEHLPAAAAALEDDPVSSLPAAGVAAWQGPPGALSPLPEGPSRALGTPLSTAARAQTLPRAVLRGSPHPRSYGGTPSLCPSEEQGTPGTEGALGAAAMAEGPPALPDGFVPDNEVFVAQAPTAGAPGTEFALFCTPGMGGRWEPTQ
ncbi:microtubule-actin cross-linking factor 1, isoforms 6/7-like [Ammospiza caudacuta]|uniref:microtubule-actin cross-linking factor 1, isoforms 6/7-like n=1 Tax=Ammospiza caudacuta TaxID=2857398 RepID=UPI00273999A3|nr:microtubule-actin cross-linking factor 1, isoforms 6/7-like [Ammospiza caudacuta]